jgi:hypothetical protein
MIVYYRRDEILAVIDNCAEKNGMTFRFCLIMGITCPFSLRTNSDIRDSK